MTLHQILTFDVRRILQFDLNRILTWDIGNALTQPIRNPVLKAVAGWLVGIMVFGLGSMSIGISLSDATINLLAVTSGIAWAVTSHRRSPRRDSV